MLTATTNTETGYLITFTEWTSSNTTYIPSITSNPSETFTWPAMPTNTGITLTANASKEASSETPYTIKYYLQNTNNNNYTLYRTTSAHGTTGNTITEAMVTTIAETVLATNIANCTYDHSDITPTTVISANGNTVVNVYYNRKTYTLNIVGGNNIAEIKVTTPEGQNVDNEATILITKTLKWGTNVNIETTIENLPGYTYEFIGWTTESTANLGTNYNSSNQATTITMPAENTQITATANKTANTYKINFNSNTGSGTMANEQFTYNEAQNLTANNFTKPGYTFKGWTTFTVLEKLNNETITLDEVIQAKVTEKNGAILPEEVILLSNQAQILNLTTTNNETINLYAVWKDETAPELNLTNTPTTNSIEVKVTAVEQGSGLTGNYKYYIGTMQEVDDGLGGTTQEIVYSEPIEKAGTIHTFEGLEDNTTYYIKVEKSDKAGNIGKIENIDVTTNELVGEITFTDQYWSNGKYILTVNTEATDENGETYPMQYQILTAEEIENLKAQGKTDAQILAGEGVTEEKWEGEIILSGEILRNERVDVVNGTRAMRMFSETSGDTDSGDEHANGNNNENNPNEETQNTRQTEPEKSVANLVLKDGDIVYARVYDGVNGADQYYSYSIANPAKKTYTETELAQVQYGVPTYEILGYETTTNSFKVDIEKEISGTDTYNYYAKSSSEDEYKLISTSTNWNDKADVSNELLEKTTLNGSIQLVENETYKVKVLTRKADGTVTQCLNTATIIVQEGAQINTAYPQNRTYVDVQNHTAIIPAGFKVSSETNEDKIANGMVLKDADDNEFVWVPVNQAKYIAGATAIPTNTSSTTTYYKPMSIAQIGNDSAGNEFYQSIVYTYNGIKSYRNTDSTGIGNSSYREPSLITGNNKDPYTWNISTAQGTALDANSINFLNTLGFSNTQEFGNYMNKEYTNMVKSTDTYGGFYISRYEASATEVGTLNGKTLLQAQSKPNKLPMSNINWYELYYNSDSNRNANNKYYTYTSVTSSMIWGSQYDSVLNWILQGVDKFKLQSTTYGNKSNIQAETGTYIQGDNADVINNICDLIANTYECTQEAKGTDYRIIRGSSFSTLTNENATTRRSTNPGAQGPGLGTRLTLYINENLSSKAPVVNIVETSSTMNSITIKVNTAGAGVSQYYYSISTDKQNWQTYESYSSEYTYTNLIENSTYFIKVQARAQGNKNNMSNVDIAETKTKKLEIEDDAIYVISKYGSNGKGIVKLGLAQKYQDENWNIEYQIKLGQSAIQAGKTEEHVLGRYLELDEDGIWIKDTTINKLYENDIVYVRLNDGNNTTNYKTINIEGLEIFSSIYETTSLYTDSSGKSAIIPKGFSVGVSDGIKNIDTGLVIQDADENQYVWVPVENALYTGSTSGNLPYPTNSESTLKYKPMAIYQNGSTRYYQSLLYNYANNTNALSFVNTGWKLGSSEYREPSLVTGTSDGYTWDLEKLKAILGTNNDALYYKTSYKFNNVVEYGKYKNEEYKNMIDSIEYYKGFYVGRYETSMENSRVQSQFDKQVLDNNIYPSGKSYLYAQDSNRNNSNPYYGNNIITSSMIWDTQYDAMINWMLQNNNNIEKLFSTTLGNRSGTVNKSANNPEDFINNIFDLCANVTELTQGSYYMTSYTVRGGNFKYGGRAIYRENWDLAYTSLTEGFRGSRITLYLTKPNDTIPPTIEINQEKPATATTNSIYISVNANENEGIESSGIKKYYYYISEDGIIYTEHVGWGNSYTFTNLKQGTTYWIKAKVEDKAGNESQETLPQEISTNTINGEDTNLVPRIYGESGNGRAYFNVPSEFKNEGYKIQYQIIRGDATFDENNTWSQYTDGSDTIKGLYDGDKIYIRLSDGVNNIYCRTVTINKFEEYSNTYEQTGIYTDPTGKTATIPAGFKVGTSEWTKYIDNGLVIKDASNGNEFVWVPVNAETMVYDGVTTVTNDGKDLYKPMVQYQAGCDKDSENQFFESISYEYNNSFSTGSKPMFTTGNMGTIIHQLGTSNRREPSLVTGTPYYTWEYITGSGNTDSNSSNYQLCGFSNATDMGVYMNNEYTNMVQSIIKYKGFYVGRFETSVEATNNKKVVSRLKETPKGATNKWYGLYFLQDSKKNADNPYYNSSSVVSSMIWGAQYDAILNWILKGNDRNVAFDGKVGNRTGTIYSTGSFGKDSMNNIFDLSANLWEWTQEANGSEQRMARGGRFYTAETNNAVSRMGYWSNFADGTFGSRLALYIK